MKTLLTLLLTTAALVASEPMQFAPFMRPESSSSTVSNNLFAWWVADDASGPFVQTWADRIQSYEFSQPTGANRPTLTVIGGYEAVVFANSTSATNWMTNAVIPFHTNIVLGFILNLKAGSLAGTHPAIWASGGNVCTEAYAGLQLDSNGDAYDMVIMAGCFTPPSLIGDHFGGLTNVLMDFVVSQVNSDIACYTNGLLSATTTGDNLITTLGPTHLGRNPFRATGCTFDLYELLVWTNKAVATAASELHARRLAAYP